MNHYSFSASLLAAMLVTGAASVAQGPTLLRDINQTPRRTTFLSGVSSSVPIAQTASTVFFTGQTEDTGIELWKTDGTAAGTVIVQEKMLGENSAQSTTIGNPQNLYAFNGRCYYTYWTLEHGRELWVSSGNTSNPNQTYLVKDINPGTAPQSNAGAPQDLFDYNGYLYFLADDGQNGYELWTSDGTDAGTFIAWESIPGPGTLFAFGFGGPPRPEFVVNQGVMYFTASGFLYALVGTPGNLTVVQIDANDPVQGSIFQLTSAGNQLFFTAETSGIPSFGPDVELFKLDLGTVPDIQLVADIIPGQVGSSPQNLTEHRGELFFSCSDAIKSNGQRGNVELWKSDGTLAGTLKAAEINFNVNPNNGDPIDSFPAELLSLGNQGLFFAASDNVRIFSSGFVSAVNRELWVWDGTSANKIEINPDLLGDSNPDDFCQLNSQQILLEANDGTNGTELWISDGTAAGTMLVADIRPGSSGSSPSRMTRISNTRVVFTADNGVVSREMWVSDGTTAGTQILKDIRTALPGQTNGSSPSGLTDTLKGFAMFAANDGVGGTELWRTDGTTLGTVPFKDINVGSSSSSPSQFAVAGQNIFFRANDGTNGTELWVTNGTQPVVGTFMVKDIRPGSSSSFPDGITGISGGRVVFGANGGANGTELWVSDGTDPGTFEIDIVQGSGSSFPRNFYYWNGEAYFVGRDQFNIAQIFKTDGTVGGTGAVTAFGGGNISTFGNPFLPFGGKLWIVADDGATGSELYSIDDVGNVVPLDLNLGGGSNPGALTVWNGALYFLADVGLGIGYELYKTDGTLSGTVLVKDINPFPNTGSAFPNDGIMFGLDSGLVLFADDGTHGSEPWISDGTTAGTQLLVDIVAGPESSNPSFGANLGTRRAVFRAAGRPTDDDEPWVTDGTVAGTYQFGNINPGNSRSSPSNFSVLNGKLIFQADEYLKGSELYVWDQGGAVAKPVGKSSGTAASGYPTFEVTDPVLGGFIEFRGEEAPAGSVGFIYYGLPVAGEFVEPTFEVHTIYNVAPIFLFNVMPAPDGSYSLTIPMPNIPGLAGLPIGFQNYFGPCAAPFTVASTNAVYSQFGY